VQEVAANTASGPTVAQGATTRLLTESFDRSLESQLAAETDEMAKAVQTDDYERGIAAFFGDEEPDFRGE
jgi:2-(1,2-epoxy-1,2-dihydrophenyl)acetyl-CoA isomerase